MKPVFTIHEGEYLVGSYIENKFKKINLWVPSKDTGVDLLISDFKNSKFLTLQVKFSKDYLPTHPSLKLSIYQENLKACSWFKISKKQILNSQAELWVFIICGFYKKKIQNYYIVIRPEDLLNKLTKIHGDSDIYWLYFWITQNDKCWEVRGLNKKELNLIVNDAFNNKKRNFTSYLNNWQRIEELNFITSRYT